MKHEPALKRAYEPPSPDDGRRILVDRLWPRGVSKEEARIDDWLKAVAPSTELRRWFGHRVDRWPEFRERYLRELSANPAFAELREMVAAGPATLVYAAKDPEHNNAVVLKEHLRSPAAGDAR